MRKFVTLPISKAEKILSKWDVYDYDNVVVDAHDVPYRKTEQGLLGFTLLKQNFHNRIQRKNLQ